jgi:hypothetical protein
VPLKTRINQSSLHVHTALHRQTSACKIAHMPCSKTSRSIFAPCTARPHANPTDHGTRPGSLTLNQSKTPELFTARDWLNTNKSDPGLRRGRCRASLWHAVTICLLFPARACRNGRLHIAFLQCCRRSRGAWACRDYGWGNPEHWARECRRRMIDLGCKSDNVRRCGGLLVERRDILLWPSVCAASWEFETWLMGLR